MPEDRELADHEIRMRLHLLTGIESAPRRHQEVLDAIHNSADRVEAVTAVGALLGLDETQAQSVLDLQWSGLTTTRV